LMKRSISQKMSKDEKKVLKLNLYKAYITYTDSYFANDTSLNLIQFSERQNNY